MVRHNHSLIIESNDKSTRRCSSEARRNDVSKETAPEDGDLLDCQRLHHINGNIAPKDQTEKTKRWIWTSWSCQFGRKREKEVTMTKIRPFSRSEDFQTFQSRTRSHWICPLKKKLECPESFGGWKRNFIN